ncbi:unnamed protein product, partial [Polarella glacialis]
TVVGSALGRGPLGPLPSPGAPGLSLPLTAAASHWQPPGLERPNGMSAWDMPMKLVMDEGDRLWPTQSEVPTSSTKAPSSSAVPRRGFGATSTTAGSFVGRRAGLREDRDSVVEDEDPDTGNLELPKASGHLSAVLARAALE